MILQFMPISPNVGIAFYFNISSNEILLKKEENYQQKSRIFKNDVSILEDKVIYKNKKTKQKEKDKNIKKIKKNNINLVFLNPKTKKYLHKNDKFIYKVLEEKNEIVDICNARLILHNEKHILIYQKNSNINDAEYQIKKGIYKIENYN